MKIDILYQRYSYYIGYSTENNLLCAWEDIYDFSKNKDTHIILCQFNSKTKEAMFSVRLCDEYMNKNFLAALDKYLKKYGFNSKA